MTPPCANCHGATGTSRLSEDRTERSDCPAEARWPEWIATAEPELREQAWWVRSNFEMARESRLPLRVTLGRGELSAELRLRSGSRSFAAFPWGGSPYHAVGVEVSSGASLNSRLEVRDNALLLGLRNLVEISGVHVDGPLFVNAWPERISVGNFGELHAISRTGAGALFFLDPFMVPRPPLGQDFPAGDQWNQVQDCLLRPRGIDAGAEPCYPPVVYPNHRDNPRIDQLLTDFLPAEILDSNGRLPTRFNLETLLQRILDWRRAHPSTAAADPRGPLTRARAILEQVETWLEPGSRLTLNLEQVDDLFVPGILDLGPSRGNFEVSYHGGQRIGFESRGLEINLDPMDFPSRPGPDRPGVRIESATLSAAAASAELRGIETPPGLRVEFDAASGRIWVEGNLRLQLDAAFPLLGAVELEGQLLFRSTWQLSDTGLQPVPETTSMEFRHGELWEAGGRRPILNDFTLTFSDQPVALPGLELLFEAPSGNPTLRLGLSGWRPNAERLEAEVEVPLRELSAGGYDWENLLRDLPAQVALQLNGSHSYAVALTLSAATEEVPGGPESLHRRFQVDFDITQGAGGETPSRPLIREGRLEFHLDREDAGRDQYRLNFSAAALDWGPVALRGLTARSLVDRFEIQDGVTMVRIPELRFGLDALETSRGALRGPIALELAQNAGEGLMIVWNGPERRLEVEDLDLRFNAAGFTRRSVDLRGIEARVFVDLLQWQNGVAQIRVPELTLSLNPHGSASGMLRGPIVLALARNGGEGLRIRWNHPERHLEVEDLDLRLRASGLRVLPAGLRNMLDPAVVGIGLDGHFEGNFRADFPEDERRWRARGDLRLRGDRDGDVYLMDAAGRRVGHPLVRDTRWRWSRVDRIDWRRRYALGDFHLDTLLNISALMSDRGADAVVTEAFGARGQRLLPYEVNGVMPYDNQPWSLQGFQNRIVDYLLALCRQSADCREGGRAR